MDDAPTLSGADGVQSSTVAFLGDPAAHGNPGGGVRVIETHCALVFLAGDRAIKIKKAVSLPYLDFTTLEKRRRACLREIELNKPAAPAIYLDALPITRSARGAMAIGGDGEIVEWAVVMRRFPDHALLSAPGTLKSLDASFFDALADGIAAWHVNAEIDPRTDGAARIRAVADDVAAALLQAPDLVDPVHAKALSVAVGNAWARSRRVLDFRARIGKVRRCHGDLHLGNIVDLDGEPVPFDALEFDEELAITDVLYDLAFLLMDLDERGHRAAANRVLNRYLVDAGSMANYYGLHALPLFMACRAAIRARVLVDRIRQQAGPISGETRNRIAHLMKTALADLHGGRPTLVAIGGLSGTGKTTLANGLAPSVGRTPGAIHLRSDVERKAMFGVAESTRLPANAYSPKMHARVYKRLLRKTRLGLAAGQSVIVDAVHLKSEERDALLKLARATGVSFIGFWLRAGERTLIERVERRATNSADASDATAEIVRAQRRQNAGPMDWTIVDAGGDPGQVIDTAKLALDRLRRGQSPGVAAPVS